MTQTNPAVDPLQLSASFSTMHWINPESSPSVHVEVFTFDSFSPIFQGLLEPPPSQ